MNETYINNPKTVEIEFTQMTTEKFEKTAFRVSMSRQAKSYRPRFPASKIYLTVGLYRIYINTI